LFDHPPSIPFYLLSLVTFMHALTRTLLATAALLWSCSLFAQNDAALRKTLAERLPQLPKIDEIMKSPVAGLFEVRFGGTQILYTDAAGDYIFVNGAMVDTKTRVDLTEARIDKLTAVDFDKLPVKDAITIKQGSGARKMAVFVDPNCGYCKRFERDLTTIKDVTIYTFLIPILGPDSSVKSRDIWCAKDQVQTWRAWMLDNVSPPKTEAKVEAKTDVKTDSKADVKAENKADTKCDTAAIERNLEFSRQQRINGTPAVFFTDGTRKPGAIPAATIEKLLVAAAAAPKKP
jgi:thiol:disulfide interchange protein DsbC